MNVLNKLTIKNLKLNKKRSIGTIIGIILSTALICAVSGMSTSVQQTLVQNAINEYGYYHIELNSITNEQLEKYKLNKDIEEIHSLYRLGYSTFEHEGDDPYLFVYSISEEDLEDMSFEILEGNFPQNENEIAINAKVASDSDYKIGDTISLSLGSRQTEDGYELNDTNPYVENEEVFVKSEEKEYEIVGIVYHEMKSEFYEGYTTNDTSNKIDAYVALSNPRDYKSTFCELLGADTYNQVEFQELYDLNFRYNINHELLRWEAFSFSDSTFQMLLAIISVVIFIIILTSVYCIRNSFEISTTEKMKMYGMLSSVGATKKQIKKSVISEGFILGIIAIPIGIISGIFAVYVLVKVVNVLLGDALFNSIDGLVFKISILPVLLSILLAFITIYFSSITSAAKASRVSPIDNLRSSKEIKMNHRQLKTPALIRSIFKTGGVIAYKNLQRSKKKYRTTVLSLTISIFIFITMSSFVNEGFDRISNYYVDYDYNLYIYGGLEDYDNASIDELRNLKNVDESFMTYTSRYVGKVKDGEKINRFEDDGNHPAETCDENGNCSIVSSITIVALDDATFRKYADKIGLDAESVKDKGILIDEYIYYSTKTDKEKVERRYNYQKGDIMNLEGNDLTGTSYSCSIEIAAVTKIRPYGLENSYSGGGYLVINKETTFEKIEFEPYKLLIQTSTPNELANTLEIMDSDFYIINFAKEVEDSRSMLIVVSIFLYGFITVITLIGITNIFNTITSNMELRSKEFAMLKSVGMTKKEFNNMINLETLFYSTKSLVFGTILGIIGSYIMHQAFSINVETAYHFPLSSILLCIVFVFIIVYLIMRYSLGIINKQNTIETIRKENI